MTYYVAVDIGCIECGESSSVLGVFTDKDTAEKTADAHGEWQQRNWMGQHYFEVFTVEELDQPIPVPPEVPA